MTDWEGKYWKLENGVGELMNRLKLMSDELVELENVEEMTKGELVMWMKRIVDAIEEMSKSLGEGGEHYARDPCRMFGGGLLRAMGDLRKRDGDGRG